MPVSTACWIALIHSASSEPPHIQPPIAQVPSPTRPRGTGTFSQLIVSISIRSNYTILPVVHTVSTNCIPRQFLRLERLSKHWVTLSEQCWLVSSLRNGPLECASTQGGPFGKLGGGPAATGSNDALRLKTS